MKKYSLLLFLMLVVSIIQAQTEVKDFSLINVHSGQAVTLNQFSSHSGVAIIFYSNECPYDNYYKERIRSLVTSYGAKIQFLLVNPYQEPAESTDKMAIHYGDLNIPYLADKDQIVMNNLGAKKSPEVFLLKNAGGKFSLYYSGAIDDNAQTEKDVTSHYLKSALDQLISNQAAPESNRAVGCTIRKK